MDYNSKILHWRGFDHWIIKLSIVPFMVNKNPSFKFQIMWLHDPSIQELMVDCQCEGMPTFCGAIYSFAKILQYVKFRLKKWDMQCFGNLDHNNLLAQAHLDSITCHILDHGLSFELCREEIIAAKALEE